VKTLAVLLAAAAVALAWHGRPHQHQPLTAALKANCGTVSQCVRRQIVGQLAARGETGNVRVFCPSVQGVPVVCDTVIDMTADGDPACFRYWLDWPSLRLLKSIDDTQTRLCNELVY
jgi:hypothetical protein